MFAINICIQDPIEPYGFEVLALNRMVINCASENSRSRAIPERLDFTNEGTCRNAEWLYSRRHKR